MAIAVLALAAPSAQAATWTVNTTADESLGSCAVSCSLRDAVALAEENDTIQIPAGHYKLILGDIIFAKSLTINGEGARTTVLDGNRVSRIFHVIGPPETTVLEINDLAMIRGRAVFQLGGGALVGDGLLRLNRCRVADSESVDGGGILWGGDAILDRCTLSGNIAAHGLGGGFFGTGGTVTMINTTLTRNVAAFGGGLSVYAGQVLLVNTTITENQAIDGGGIEVHDGGENHAINSIISSNVGLDCLSAFGRRSWILGEHSLFGSGTCGGDIFFDFAHGNRFGNARVAPLLDKSGPTDTRALVAGSLAINGGNNSFCPPVDQRGVPRPQNGPCDIGAYERRPEEPPILELAVDKITEEENDFAFNHLSYAALGPFPVSVSVSEGSLTRDLVDGSYQWFIRTGDGPDHRIVTFTGDDGHGSLGTASFQLDVLNAAPEIFSLTNDGPVVAGAEALITIEAHDRAGALDPLSYEVDCDGNGIFEVGPQAAASAACRFATAGLHTVNVRVTDGDGGEALAATEVMVNPDCSHATASPSLLWPPNHDLVPIQISGVLGGGVTLTAVSIFQDEPVRGNGTGNTAPDGSGVGTGSPSVRAERENGGDGRVYHISFTAAGGGGSGCTGTVTVGVPKNQGNQGGPVDQGSLYNSTLP